MHGLTTCGEHEVAHAPSHAMVEVNSQDFEMNDAADVMPDTDISRMIHELSSENEHEVSAAAEFLFERAHTSHIKSFQNKEQMRMEGAIPSLVRVLTCPMSEARYNACSALSELAFQNKNNCLAILNTPGALESLTKLMSMREEVHQGDACLVINNCAAFCSEFCFRIAMQPGLVESLKTLATQGCFDSRNVAVGALNCLSRCERAREVLLKQRVVEDALVPVLQEQGAGDKFEARLSRAAMALANLVGDDSSCVLGEEQYRHILANTVRILGFASEGRSWAGIHFAPYGVLYPFRKLASNPSIHPYIVECGMVESLARCIKDRARFEASDATLELALMVTKSLLEHVEHHPLLRQAGMIRMMRQIKTDICVSEECKQIASEIMEKLLEGHLAVWTGQHARLGAQSPLHLLDEFITGIILDYAFENH
eukprot:764510-Hanusia_phi.AAC.3